MPTPKELRERINNARYWQKRYEQLEGLTNRDNQALITRLKELYKEVAEKLELLYYRFYKRFADIEHISLTEAQRLLNSEELSAFKMSVQEYIAYGETLNIKYDASINKMLEEASLKYRVTRLEATQYQMAGEIAMLLGKSSELVYEHLANTYIDRYYRSIFEISKGYGIGLSFEMVDMKRLEAILDFPWAADGSNFSSRIWKNGKALVNSLSTSLARACITGEGYSETLDQLSKELMSSQRNAARLIVTESAYFSSRAQKESYDTLGAEKYQIFATLDNRTSVICQELDLKVFDVKDFKAGVTAPPFHPNCRTTTAPYFDDSDVEGFTVGMRAARMREGGRTERVPRSMSYKEWCKRYGVDPIYKPTGRQRVELNEPTLNGDIS